MYRHHSLEEKLRAIELYDRGYGSTTIGKLLSVDKSQVRRWINGYRERGIDWLNHRSYTYSSAEFKCGVVRLVLEKYLSCDQVALQYGISRSAVGSWVRKVRAHGYDALFETKPRGRPPKTMGRPRKKEPQTELEKLRERVERLEAENALLKKVKALVEEREARLREIGFKPSKN